MYGNGVANSMWQKWQAEDRIAAVEGIPQNVSMDNLKAFSAAAASSGAVGLFHIIVT